MDHGVPRAMRQKTILLYCSDVNRRRELSFQLRTWGFAVLAGLSPFPPIPDAALVVDDLMGATAIARTIATGEVPIVVLTHSVNRIKDYPTTAQFLSDISPSSEIRDRMSKAVRHTRGRKLGYLVSDATRVRISEGRRAGLAKEYVA
jgi:hypothetical protein